MCRLSEILSQESATGYKVVAEKNGKNYSVAFGFCYDGHKLMPNNPTQKQIGWHFVNNIMTSGTFVPHMQGRTAILVERRAAIDLYHEIINAHDGPEKIVVKEAVVTNGLMTGTYGNDAVIAGREIKFMKTISRNKSRDQ